MARLVPSRNRKEGIATIAEILPELKDRLKTADQLPAALTPPEPVLERLKSSHRLKSQTDSRAEQEPPPREVVTSPEREPVRTHAERLNRPVFLPVPADFKNVDSYPVAGIKLNRSLDKRIIAVQFSEDRLPSREEKDTLQALSQPEHLKFTYDPRRKHWQRIDGDNPTGNLLDAKELVAGLANERMGRGR